MRAVTVSTNIFMMWLGLEPQQFRHPSGDEILVIDDEERVGGHCAQPLDQIPVLIYLAHYQQQIIFVIIETISFYPLCSSLE
jgi:hypothetical protein